MVTGGSPLDLASLGAPSKPALTAEDITGIRASFVADPFLVRDGAGWLMFFEVMNRESRRGEIGLARSSDGVTWRHETIVLREPFHLSYPHIFHWQGDDYMLPETLGLNAIVLYEARCFPYEWEPVSRLVEGMFADPTPFQFEGRWWMFACSTPYVHDVLRLYYASDLTGPWTEHPLSPVVQGNPRIARPGGPVTAWSGRLIRYAQDCVLQYGHRLRAFEITALTTDRYEERECPESPILFPSDWWNSAGMHHADPHLLPDGTWIASVDGYRFEFNPA
jgi:hypothetical protein